LELLDLSVQFDTPGGVVSAVDELCLSIGSGTRVGLVGESGCGKTVIALAILGLLPRNARTYGAALFEGRDLLVSSVAASLRGRYIAMCWSNAVRFFNPVMKIGTQISEAYLRHHPGERRQARELAMCLLGEMGFNDAARVYESYPFQLSGGMNQRAMIAMSVINRPRLLLVDEPTRGLDDESRQSVLKCLLGISGVSMLIITHDMDLVRQLAVQVFIMRNGVILDHGPCPEALDDPQHPYTRMLVEADLIGRGAPEVRKPRG
jgi:ABC-type dipeptide/oligopeptide/nickel transport system ATPase component